MAQRDPPFELDLARSPDPRRRLAGRAAIVTGAGCAGSLPGTGAAIAALFASQGAQVGVVDISHDRAETTVAIIEGLGGTAEAVLADITSPTECERSVGDVVRRFGRLDILVNNAAISPTGDRYDVRSWNRVVALDLTAVMLMTKAAVGHLRSSGSGAIVNMSSIAGMRGMGGGAYAAAKAGVIGLTYDLAYAHAREGVRVNCVAPGHLHTPMGGHGGEEMRDLRRRAGLLGTEGTAWDAAWAALFLASDESRWITGHVLPVDAGTTASTALGLQMLERGADLPGN